MSNYQYNNNNCAGNGHAIDNPQQRLQSMVDFFSEKIAATGNNPQTNCGPMNVNLASNENILKVINPFDSQIEIDLNTTGSTTDFSLSNMAGHTVASGKLNAGANTIDTSKLVDGVYLLNVSNTSFSQIIKLVKN